MVLYTESHSFARKWKFNESLHVRMQHAQYINLVMLKPFYYSYLVNDTCGV